jgi:Arc/MetJ family transcription regulator
MPDQPATPQMNVRVPEDIRTKAIAIARIKKERDRYGFGASVVVRRALARYVAQHEHLLHEQG